LFYNDVATLTSQALYEAIVVHYSMLDSSEVGISEKIVQLIAIHRTMYEESKGPILSREIGLPL
tara:strand:+ start:303 stop:494 length:192 start_codon:yes stop_codon:yes gene_type:complete